MTYRTPAAVAALLVLAGDAAAQPVAPARRPAFSSYSNLYGPGGGGYYGAGGFNPYGSAGGFGGGFGGPAAAQQAIVQQQLVQTTQAVANLQQILAYGTGVQAYSPTGRGGVFNQLGHWYPTYQGGGVPFGSGGGGGGFGPVVVGGQRSGVGGLMNTALTGAATVNAVGGAAAPRTSGTGIPVGPTAQPKR